MLAAAAMNATSIYLGGWSQTLIGLMLAATFAAWRWPNPGNGVARGLSYALVLNGLFIGAASPWVLGAPVLFMIGAIVLGKGGHKESKDKINALGTRIEAEEGLHNQPVQNSRVDQGMNAEQKQETMFAFIIGGVLLLWTYGALTAGDNYAIKLIAVMIAGLPGVGLIIYGINLLFKYHTKMP